MKGLENITDSKEVVGFDDMMLETLEYWNFKLFGPRQMASIFDIDYI